MKGKGKNERVEVIQWHPAFCAAMRLELKENQKELIFQNEHNLGKKPLQVDLLVIKKSEEISIQNEVGRIFRKHNLLEYKSPDDELGIAEFYKVMAYACLYKTQEEQVDDIPENEITVTIVRERKPLKLLAWLRKNHFPVKNTYRGVYYIGDVLGFPIQLLVGRELSKENHIWLTSLTKQVSEEQAYHLVLSMNRLSEKADKENADAVLEVTMKANPKTFSESDREGKIMCEELLKLMKPRMDELEARSTAAGRSEGFADGRLEGFADGRSEGRTEERLARIADAFSLGFSMEQITSLFHPTEDELQLAKARLNRN